MRCRTFFDIQLLLIMSTHSKSLAEVVTSLINESLALVYGAHFITLTKQYLFIYSSRHAKL